MSWLRSALNKAAEAGVKSGLGRNLQKYAGSVHQFAGNAVAGGTRILQNSLGGKHYNNFKHAVHRLEDVALNARGEDRQQALSRWLGALKDLQKVASGEPLRGALLGASGSSKRLLSGDANNGGGNNSSEGVEVPSPRREGAEEETGGDVQGVHRANLVLFYDEEISKEPMTFRDVFLRSLALENIVTSFIEEAPEDEEVAVVLEMFGLCLAGGPELHNAIMSGIQDLSKAAHGYTEEVQLNRAVLLQMVRDCVAGLKLSAEAERLDAEVARLRVQLEKVGAGATAKDGATAVAAVAAVSGSTGGLGETPQEPALKESAARTGEVLRLSARLQECLERKAALLKGTVAVEDHQKKVDEMREKAKVLQVAMADMKKKIEENKQQKLDATTYRTSKAKEVAEAEKVLGQEVMGLEQRREKLEAELKEVKAAIAAATHRHIYIQEEKEQFDEASSHIVAQLAKDEADLAHSVDVHRIEAGVAATWQSFLEDTWVLQTGCQETRGKETEAALKEARAHYQTSAATHLSYRQEELGLLLKRLKSCAGELEGTAAKRQHMEELGMDNVVAEIEGAKKKMEEKYLEAEAQAKRVFAAVEKTKEGVLAHTKDDKETAEAQKALEGLFSALAKLKDEFSSLVRPKIDTPAVPSPRKDAPRTPGKVAATAAGVAAGAATGGAVAPATSGSKKAQATGEPKQQVESPKLDSNEQGAKKEKPAEGAGDAKGAEGEDEDEEFWKEAGIDPGEAVEAEGNGEEGWDFDQLEEELGRK